MLNSVIRCYVKDQNRLNLLEKTIQSCLKQHLNDLGPITIVDDGSPLKNNVKELANKYNVNYLCPEEYKSSTNQGLCNALKAFKNEPYTLQLTDDVILCKDFNLILNKLLKYQLTSLGSYGIITMFCPQSVAMHLRKGQTFNGTNVYRLDTTSPLIHAFICTLMSKDFADVFIRHWEDVRGTDREHDQLMDDIRARVLCNKAELSMYITKQCWAEHTGTNPQDRTFQDARQGGNSYRAASFLGE